MTPARSRCRHFWPFCLIWVETNFHSVNRWHNLMAFVIVAPVGVGLGSESCQIIRLTLEWSSDSASWVLVLQVRPFCPPRPLAFLKEYCPSWGKRWRVGGETPSSGFLPCTWAHTSANSVTWQHIHTQKMKEQRGRERGKKCKNVLLSNCDYACIVSVLVM